MSDFISLVNANTSSSFADDLMKIQEFKKKCGQSNSYHVVDKIKDIRKNLERDLDYNIDKILST